MPRGTSLIDEAQLQRRLWTPDVLRPSAWFDAQERRTLSADGSGVTTWADKSGNGINASRITSGISPVINEFGINSLPALTFTQDALNLPSGFLFNITNYSIAFIARSSGSSNGALFGPTDNYATGIEILSTGSGSSSLRLNSGAATVFSSGLYSIDNVAGITIITSSSASVNAWFNGSSVAYGGGGSTTGVALNYNGSYAIGRYASNVGSFYLDMTMGEFIVFPFTLSDAQQQVVTGSLAHKWGAQDRLPASHPFRNRPPMIGD